ncbi:hypothetical protein P5673_006313 [Acropora cervicornis]|uniref:Uncharacterized protein n=1 Tax=Acropora cervicornis TaxID=6130 RepID=A0AAD9VCZ4_ACRCE|nr:hypothetical protein P5673_006313 [Acropora cervicornis]
MEQPSMIDAKRIQPRRQLIKFRWNGSLNFSVSVAILTRNLAALIKWSDVHSTEILYSTACCTDNQLSICVIGDGCEVRVFRKNDGGNAISLSTPLYQRNHARV